MVSQSKNLSRKIDVVIPYHGKDGDIIRMCIKGCIKNVRNLGNIYVVTKSKHLPFSNFQLIDEDKLFDDNLSKGYIDSRLTKEGPELARLNAGWLFQQFIKMGSSYAIKGLTDYYLVVDADVVFLKKISFFRNELMLLTKTKYYHSPHFDCYQRLFGESANREYSFVAHHMLISKVVMCDLLDKIEKKFNKIWYDAILDNLDNAEFSEYETYGHYLKNHYPNKFILRELNNVESFRLKHLLKMLLNQADYFTFHNYKKPENNPKVNPFIYELALNLVRKKLRE